MHDCPWCGQACDCDGEDTWMYPPIGCQHCPDGDFEDEEASASSGKGEDNQ